jgi:hypothetical protein
MFKVSNRTTLIHIVQNFLGVSNNTFRQYIKNAPNQVKNTVIAL